MPVAAAPDVCAFMRGPDVLVVVPLAPSASAEVDVAGDWQRRSRTSASRFACISTGKFDVLQKYSETSGKDDEMSPLLLIIIVLLILFAIGGGVWVSNLLWLLLIIALIVLVVGFLSGRRAV